MRALLDVNVLVALLDRHHAAHRSAHEWLAENRTHGWASCPLTENGCLRVLSNPRYPGALSSFEILEKLASAERCKFHQFWSDDLTMTSGEHFLAQKVWHHQQVTDSYLLALATHRGGRLVTFDQGISLSAVAKAEDANLLVLQAD